MAKKKPSSADIAKLKRKRDRLDREILLQLNERAQLDQQIEAVKPSKTNSQTAASTAVDDGLAQAADLVQRNKGPLTDEAVRFIWREVTSGCRSIRNQTRVAFLGPEHSYSHIATVERFGHSADLVPVGSIEAVFAEVHAGQCEFGLVPLENSTDGRIVDTLDMFVRVPVKISGEVLLAIHHNLLGVGPRSKVQKVLSKPQAISQCRGWLTKHLPQAKLVETSSTTAAAEKAANDKTVAAIASHQAGKQYGLKVLAKNIEDNRDNVTRFAVIGQESAARTGNDKTAILFQVAHQPGALADAMMIFKRNKLNMTWIESFPVPGRKQEYLFFVEVQGHQRDLKFRKAITALEKKSERLDILGSFAMQSPV